MLNSSEAAKDWPLGLDLLEVNMNRILRPFLAVLTSVASALALSVVFVTPASAADYPASVPAQPVLERFAAPEAPPLADGMPELTLPFTSDELWIFQGGPHGWPSAGQGDAHPWSSLDFAPRDGANATVRAAADGTIARDGSCAPAFVRVIHGNGWSTSYYHLINIPQGITDGATVKRGDPIGEAGQETPCGGTPGPRRHVHMTLWHHSGAFLFGMQQQENWNGHTIGGLPVEDGSAPYAGCLIDPDFGGKNCAPNQYASAGMLMPRAWIRDAAGSDKPLGADGRASLACGESFQYTLLTRLSGATTVSATLLFDDPFTGARQTYSATVGPVYQGWYTQATVPETAKPGTFVFYPIVQWGGSQTGRGVEFNVHCP
jgi:hypothetical protein